MSQPTPPPYDPGTPEPSPYGQQQPYQQQPYQQPYAGGYAQQGYYQQTRGTNTMAVVSLIAGICGLTVVPFIGSIVGAITGHMAKRQIAETGEEGSGLATGGLVTSYIGIALAVLGIIAAILFMVVFASAASSGEFNSY